MKQGNQWHRIDARLSVAGNKCIVISHNNIHGLRIYQEILDFKRLNKLQILVEALIGCLKSGIVACNSKGDSTHFNRAQSPHGLELTENTNRVELFKNIKMLKQP